MYLVNCVSSILEPIRSLTNHLDSVSSKSVQTFFFWNILKRMYQLCAPILEIEKLCVFFWCFRCRHWPFWLCTIFSLVLIADAYLTIFIMYNVQCTTNNILSYEPIITKVWYFVALSVLSSVGFFFILEF